MRSGTIAFLFGVCVLLRCTALPQMPPALVGLLPFLALCGLLFGLQACGLRTRLCCCCLAGFLWAAWRTFLILDGALPRHLEGLELQVEGHVLSLPRIYGEDSQRRVRFVFLPTRMEAPAGKTPLPGRLLLSWYNFPEAPRAGERWRLCVRLKRPHGFVNSAGLERERYLFLQNIRGLGYVCPQQAGRRLAAAAGMQPLVLRSVLRDRLRARMGEDRTVGLILALTLGDRSLIGTEEWRVLRRTGTSHLLAVSGLHIGLAAGLAWWTARWLCSLLCLAWPCCLWLPAQRCATLAALPAALGYALLAGFSVPTQRALVMLTVLLGSGLGRSQPAPGDGLALAALCVLLWNPWAAASAGFWLSFGAVSVILLSYSKRIAGGAWWRWGRLQLLFTMALAPPLLFWFQEWPALGSLVNLLAIPWMSLLILPTALLGTLLLGVLPGLGGGLLDAAAHHLEWLWGLLEWAARPDAALWRLPRPSLPALLAGTLGVFLCLAPLPWRLRLLGPLWLTPLCLATVRDIPAPGHVSLALLDVGQGLAVVVETHTRTLVYDTGPGFPGGFNTGDAVLVPYLLNRGRKRLDTLVLSHADNDHVGGLHALLKNFPATSIYSGEAIPGTATMPCHSGQAWTWDQVRFEFLYPMDEGRQGNDASCVLKISAAGRAILLTGDLEAHGEHMLTARHAGHLDAEVLVLPHHGSRTSSTARFIASVAPVWALAATGYRNRFHLPNEDIIKRYTRWGSIVLNTAQSGMIQVKIGPGTIQLSAERTRARRIWHRPP